MGTDGAGRCSLRWRRPEGRESSRVLSHSGPSECSHVDGSLPDTASNIQEQGVD